MTVRQSAFAVFLKPAKPINMLRNQWEWRRIALEGKRDGGAMKGIVDAVKKGRKIMAEWCKNDMLEVWCEVGFGPSD